MTRIKAYGKHYWNKCGHLKRRRDHYGSYCRQTPCFFYGSVRVVGVLLPSVAAYLGHICSGVTAERFSEKE
ncbi:hypothetical protein BDC45DRAFT_559073, partial [Circinella umbellata]